MTFFRQHGHIKNKNNFAFIIAHNVVNTQFQRPNLYNKKNAACPNKVVCWSYNCINVKYKNAEVGLKM